MLWLTPLDSAPINDPGVTATCMSSNTNQPLSDLDTRKLSDFIYELNITRRHLSTYPAGHPLIETTCVKVLKILDELLEFRAELVLGIAQEALLFEGEWLERKNPVYRDFAHFLFKQGVATIHFCRQISAAEILRFLRLLRASRAEIFAQGGYPALLEAQRIEHIRIIPIDYANFTSIDLDSVDKTRAKNQENLWEDFLQGLMDGDIDPHGSHQSMPENFDPQLVAEIVNRMAKKTDGPRQDYAAVMTSFLSGRQHRPEGGENLVELMNALSPEVRRQLLNSTFRDLAETPQAQTTLQAIPHELIVTSLKEAGAGKIEIPPQILSLLASLKQHQHGNNAGTRIMGENQLGADQMQARMHLIFREEENEKFNPEAYQNALNAIMENTQTALLDPQEISQLRHEFDVQSVERQTGAIAFEILLTGTQPELKQTLQRNLIDLARFFLETGDFTALEDLYQRWHSLLDRAAVDISILNEELLDTLHSDEFIAGTLTALELYGKDKQEEIRHYILTVGEAFAQALIQRLATTEIKALRQFYVSCLEQMGTRAHAEIFSVLSDKRWYLVRNLVGILAKSPNPAVLKHIFPLLEHPHPQVRQQVLKLMFTFNRPRAEKQLLAELQSTSTSELLFAARIAHLSRDPATGQQLLNLLRQPFSSPEVFELKVEILKTLARRADAETVSILETLLKGIDLRHPRQQRRFKLEIVKTLGQYPPARVGPLLEMLIRSGGRDIAAIATEQLRLLIRSQS